MSTDSINMGKLLYKEKGSERRSGFVILTEAIILSIITYLVFWALLSAVDDFYPELDVMTTFWWVLPFALFLVPSNPYIYSFYLIAKGKGPLKIYEHGIRIRTSFIRKETKYGIFIPYKFIKKITLIYGGDLRNLFDINLNKLYPIGIRIRTIKGDKYDILPTYYTFRYGYFPYEFVQIMLKFLKNRWNEMFSVKPDIDDNEWETFLRSSRGFMNSIPDYSVKISIFGSLLSLPMFITMVLMMIDVLNDRPLFITIFITVFIAFGFLSFSTILLFKHMMRTQFELGSLFRAQEYEMLTGEIIIPKNLEIPEDFIYPGRNWPDIDSEFWKKITTLKEYKSTPGRWQNKQLYKKTIHETIIKAMRYEDLTGKNIIPGHIRHMEEVSDIERWGSRNLDSMIPKRRALELMLKKRTKLFNELEQGRPITPEMDFNPISFKEYYKRD